jgi:AAA domain-containing protein/primase-like protein/bifunctional DNA primase/polymerase-like protein
LALRNDDPFAASPPLPHEQLRAAVTARRIAYVKLGYQPIPIKSGDKRPVHSDWGNMPINLDVIPSWADSHPGALSTGVRTRRAPAVDIDIYDADVADQVERALLNIIPQGGTILKRVGLPPKRLIPFRTETPFRKIAAAFKRPGDDRTHKVEVLCDGQQFVVEGVHPDTHMPYRWADNVYLLNVAREHLPPLDEATAHRFVDEATRIMLAAGYEQTSGGNSKPKTSDKPKPNGRANGHEDVDRIKDALPFVSADDRDTWIEIGQALHAHLGNNGRAIWDQWSATCPEKYDPDDADRVWRSFGKRDGRTIASLFFRAIKGGWRDDGECAEPQSPNDTEAAGAADELKIVWASDLEMCGVDWLWPGRFALGKIGLVAGLPDYGKGQIAAFLAAAVTAAIELPCEEGGTPQGNVIWFNAEDDNRDTIIPRLAAAGANLKRVAFVNGARVDGEDKSFSLVTDLALLHKAIEKIGNVVLVIIDPVSAYLGVGKVDSRSATDVRGVLTPLKQLTEELHIAVIGIAHFNKKDDIKSALLRVSDSIAYVAAARHVYAVLDDPEDKNSKLFVKAKNNLAPDKKALRYGFGVKTVGHDTRLGKDIDAPYIVWHPQHVELTANEAMQAADGRSGYAKREAREFLLERLADGPVRADEIFEEAKQNGINQKTLKRAKKDLNIRSRKETGKMDGEWTWELPISNKGARK